MIEQHSPAPWSYDYSPYTLQANANVMADGESRELPAYEIVDAEGRKVFDTNEDTLAALQEANARLGSAGPALLTACRMVVDRWEHGDLAQATLACSTAVAQATGERPSRVGRTLTIEVRRGAVQDVSNVPPGWDYEIIDHDNAE